MSELTPEDVLAEIRAELGEGAGSARIARLRSRAATPTRRARS